MPTDHDAVALVALRDEPLSVDEVLDAVRHPTCGGIALFVGVVRDHDHGDVGHGARLRGAPERRRDHARASATTSPRARRPCGSPPCTAPASLRVGDLAVVVAAAAPHRGQAFDAVPRPHRHPQGADPDLEAPEPGRRLDRVGGPAVSTPSHDVVSDGPVGVRRPRRTWLPGMPPGAGLRAPPRPPGLLPAALLTATFVAIAIAAALTFVGLPYVVMSPGPATNILGEVDGKPLLVVDGATTYPTERHARLHDGERRGRPGRQGHPLRRGPGLARRRRGGRPRGPGLPAATPSEEQVQEEGAAEMAGSQSVATATALRALGRDGRRDGRHRRRARRQPVQAGVLEPDDVLVTRRRRPGDLGGCRARGRAAARAGRQPSPSSCAATARSAPSPPDRRVRRPHRHRRRAAARLRPAGRRHAQHRQRRRALGRPDVQPGHLRRADPGRAQRRQGRRRHRDDGGRRHGRARSAASGRRSSAPVEAGAEYFLAPADNCAEVEGAVPDGLQRRPGRDVRRGAGGGRGHRVRRHLIAAHLRLTARSGCRAPAAHVRMPRAPQSSKVARSACTSPGAMSSPSATRSSLSWSRWRRRQRADAVAGHRDEQPDVGAAGVVGDRPQRGARHPRAGRARPPAARRSARRPGRSP